MLLMYWFTSLGKSKKMSSKAYAENWYVIHIWPCCWLQVQKRTKVTGSEIMLFSCDQCEYQTTDSADMLAHKSNMHTSNQHIPQFGKWIVLSKFPDRPNLLIWSCVFDRAFFWCLPAPKTLRTLSKIFILVRLSSRSEIFGYECCDMGRRSDIEFVFVACIHLRTSAAWLLFVPVVSLYLKDV